MTVTARVAKSGQASNRILDRTSSLAFLGWLGFSVLLFYAIVIGGSWIGMYAGWARGLDLVITGIALAVWLVVAIRRPAWRPRTAIWPAFVAALAAMGLSVLGSSYQRLGLEILSYAVLLAALYLLLVRIMALPYARARIGGLMAVIALVMGVAYVGWSVLLWMEWWDLAGRFAFPPFRPALLGMTWGSPSVVLAVQVLMTAAAAGGLGFATRGARVTVACLVALAAVVALISGSRSGWLSLAGAVVIVGTLALLDHRGRALLSRALVSRPAQAAIVAIVTIGLVVAVVFGPAMLDRFASYGDGGRPTYWATAARMFADAPLLGQGPGTWMVRRVAFTQPGEVDYYQPHAHDQYLQAAAELGVVGLVAGAIAFACVAWLLHRALRCVDAVRRRWAWASLFSLVYLALDVVVDVHTIATVPLLLAVPIAVLDATSDRSIALPAGLRSVARPLARLSAMGLAVACLAAVLILARSESVALLHARAVVTAGEGDWATARGPAKEAAEADPDIAVYQLTAGLAEAASGDWEAAESRFRRVTELDGLPTAWVDLATAQIELGRPVEDVRASLKEADRLGEQQAALTLAIGQLYDRIGSTDLADDAYARTLGLVSSLAADPAWRTELGEQRFASVVEAAIGAAPGTAWEIALMAGDPQRAHDLAASLPDAKLAMDVIEAWEGDAGALARVQAAADAAPQDATRLGYAARVSAQAGDDEAAARYGRLMRLGPYFGPWVMNAAYGPRDPARDAAMGAETYFYGTYTYRRPLPLDLLVPGLWGLTVPPTQDALG